MPAKNRMGLQFVAFLQNQEPHRLKCNNFSLKILREDKVLSGLFFFFKYFSITRCCYSKLDLWCISILSSVIHKNLSRLSSVHLRNIHIKHASKQQYHEYKMYISMPYGQINKVACSVPVQYSNTPPQSPKHWSFGLLFPYL